MANVYEKHAVPKNEGYSFEELYSGALEYISKCSGIYKVYMPDNFNIKFRSDSDAPYSTYDVNELQEKWENNKKLRIRIFECVNYSGREESEIATYMHYRKEKPLANWQRGTKKSKKSE